MFDCWDVDNVLATLTFRFIIKSSLKLTAAYKQKNITPKT